MPPRRPARRRSGSAPRCPLRDKQRGAAFRLNLGNLYRNTGRLADADKALSEALSIRRDLDTHDPGAYRPAVAMTPNNLGNLYRNTGRLTDADKAYSEALTPYRDLLPDNPVFASLIASLTKALAELRSKSSLSPHPNPAPPLATSLHNH